MAAQCPQRSVSALALPVRLRRESIVGSPIPTPREQPCVRTRILLIHDRLLVREALAVLLDTEPDFDVIGHVSTVAEAFRMISATHVDCVVLEYRPGTDRSIRDLPLLCAKQRVLIMADAVPPATTSGLMNSGVAGVLPTTATSGLLADSIRKVASGFTWREVAHLRFCSTPRHGSELQLTARQRSVLRLICDGLPNKEISHQLGVSDSSVKCTIQQLFDKCNVRTRSQLIRIVIETIPELLTSSGVFGGIEAPPVNASLVPGSVYSTGL